MIAGLMLGLLVDLVFDSAASMRRGFATEMDRYFTRGGFSAVPRPPGTATR